MYLGRYLPGRYPALPCPKPESKAKLLPAVSAFLPLSKGEPGKLSPTPLSDDSPAQKNSLARPCARPLTRPESTTIFSVFHFHQPISLARAATASSPATSQRPRDSSSHNAQRTPTTARRQQRPTHRIPAFFGHRILALSLFHETLSTRQAPLFPSPALPSRDRIPPQDAIIAQIGLFPSSSLPLSRLTRCRQTRQQPLRRTRILDPVLGS